MLGQPLLLTGEPGSGKSLVARSIAHELGFEDTNLRVDVKSTTTARDLFYHFDHIGWFNTGRQSADNATEASAKDFLSLTGLGIAFALASGEDYSEFFPGTGVQRRSVVLIDEIDKAPRDVPNDLLTELEHMYFRIPELGRFEVRADPEFRPVVIITSNSEKALPPAFLRRCVFHHVTFPEQKQMQEILRTRFPEFVSETSPLVGDVLKLVNELRKPKYQFARVPSTSETIGFVDLLRRKGLTSDDRLLDQDKLVTDCLHALVKDLLDEEATQEILKSWKES